HAGAGHGDYILRRRRPGGNGPTKLGSDLSPITSFNVIERPADSSATDSTDTSPDGSTRRRIAHGIADDGTKPRPAQATCQGAAVGAIRRSTTNRDHGHQKQCHRAHEGALFNQSGTGRKQTGREYRAGPEIKARRPPA